ncbi:MAG: HEAT repeat domain-containing protein [Bryobacteraceae bacterium]
MNCEMVKKNASLFLYGELSLEEEQSFQDHVEVCADCRQAFEAEKKTHGLLDRREMEPPPELLVRCRRDLAARIQAAAGRRNWLASLLDLRVAALARPAGALALVALGFFAARWTAPVPGGTRGTEAGLEPAVMRVRYLRPEASGQVQLIVDETRQRTVTGRPEDDQIRRLLLAAARESADPGLRADSMDMLTAERASSEVRPVLLYALQHDPNPGVRLRALDALKPFSGDREVRDALARVLLADDNPGVRTQAIDLLVEHKEDSTIAVLQELVQRENNGYVRLRCQRALEEMNASVGAF